MGRRLARWAIALGGVLAVAGPAGALIVDVSFDRPEHLQPLAYLICFQQHEVLSQCASLAADGILDDADQHQIRQLLDQISARHPVAAPTKGDPASNRVNDAAAIVLAAGIGLLLAGFGTRIVHAWRTPPMVRVPAAGRWRRSATSARRQRAHRHRGEPNLD